MRRLNGPSASIAGPFERWRVWWREAFTASPFWSSARAAFMPPVDEARLPAALLERFAGSAAERLIALLRFLSPITGGTSAGSITAFANPQKTLVAGLRSAL